MPSGFPRSLFSRCSTTWGHFSVLLFASCSSPNLCHHRAELEAICLRTYLFNLCAQQNDITPLRMCNRCTGVSTLWTCQHLPSPTELYCCGFKFLLSSKGCGNTFISIVDGNFAVTPHRNLSLGNVMSFLTPPYKTTCAFFGKTSHLDCAGGYLEGSLGGWMDRAGELWVQICS